ncbi:MAG: hypothetical protein K8R68_09730, partial [Bacteroidales bacterium]|nr:hypothetical protein [Bacteroidales bacterium]
YNILNYFIEIIVDTAYADSMLILPVDSFLINVTFEEIVIDYAKGYFGQNLLIVGPETQSFSFLEDLDIGGLSMEDATINIRIENNYGADGMFKINEIIASNLSTGNSMPLQGDMIDSNLFIAGATQTGDGLHIIIPSNSTFDFSNTNFNDLLQIVPDEISYTIEVSTNPLGDSTNHNNFYYKDVPINVFVEAEVSQGIRIEDLNVVCTEPWNGEGVELEKVISGQLMLTFSNGFPFTFNMDFYLLDDSYDIIYTLFDQELIAGAIPGSDGKVAEPVETNLNLVLTEDLRSAIKLAKYGRYGITVNSVENEHVKIYSDYIMRFKINGDFEFKIEQ